MSSKGEDMGFWGIGGGGGESQLVSMMVYVQCIACPLQSAGP